MIPYRSPMCPLPCTLVALLAASLVHAAPTAPHVEATSIETIHETVTRTIIHQVTAPSEVPAKVMTLKEAKERVEKLGRDLDFARRQIEIMEADITSISIPSPTPSQDEPTKEPEDENPIIEMCSCEKAEECRKESEETVDWCIDGCRDHLESFGEYTYAYARCFSRHKASIFEAERCLFSAESEYCYDGPEGFRPSQAYITPTNWTDLTNIQYSPETDELSDNDVWKKHEPKYTAIQEFLHCTKNCMHKKVGKCTENKECTLRMPGHDEFELKMKQCTKRNFKISNAIFSTCQCLAWESGVKQLQGSCVYLGNQYYVDRA